MSHHDEELELISFLRIFVAILSSTFSAYWSLLHAFSCLSYASGSAFRSRFRQTLFTPPGRWEYMLRSVPWVSYFARMPVFGTIIACTGGTKNLWRFVNEMRHLSPNV